MIRKCACGTVWEIELDDPAIVLEPWPHFECEDCHRWISLFEMPFDF